VGEGVLTGFACSVAEIGAVVAEDAFSFGDPVSGLDGDDSAVLAGVELVIEVAQPCRD
jgi:hypothetical protein